MGDISTTISVSVEGIGSLEELAGAADTAGAALDKLEERAGKGINLGAAGAGFDKLAADAEAAFAKIQARADALNKSLADIGKGAAGGDAGAASLGKLDDALKSTSEQADAMAASVGKADDTLKGMGGSADASAAGLGKLSDAQKSVTETGAGLRDTTAGVSEGLKVQADQTAALTALQADMADSQKALTALSAEHAAVIADSNAKVATGMRLNTAASRDASAGAVAAQAEQSRAAKQAAADTEASAGKYHMLALGGAAALAYGIDKAAQLQTSVTRLFTSAGESQKNLPMMTSGILGLSGATNTSQANLAAGAYWAESAGFHGANALAVLKAGAQGAQAEGADLPTTANALTTVLNDYFGGPQKSAAAQGKMATQAMNEIITSVGLGKMTLQGESAALPFVLPVAKQAGLALPQTLGAEATMTSQGTSAEQAAQEIRHTIGAMQKPSNVQAAEMQMLGINPNQLSHDLGKQGLTGTIAEVDAAIQKHMGAGGMVMLDTLNQSKLAAQSANEEIAAMPRSIQGTAKAYLDGSISVKAFNQQVRQGGESARDANLLKQFETTAGGALGFSALVKSGLGDKQTQAAALQALMGGQMGQQVALGLGGTHMATFTSDVAKLGETAQHTGSDIRGWSDIQDTLNFKLGSFVKSAEAAATEVGIAALPAATDVLKGLGSAAGFLASHGTLTKDLAIGGGALALPAILAKVASPLATGLGAVGKVAETLHIPGLDKLAGLGKDSGLTGAASGLSGAAGSLDGAASSLEGAAASLKGEGAAGSLPGAGRAAGEAGGAAAGTEGAAAGAAEGAGGAGFFAKIFGKGAPTAGLGALTGAVGQGLVAGLVIKGIGDQMAPKGTAAGDYNKMFQQQAAQGGPASQLHPNTLGGFEGWLTQHVGQQVGGAINAAFSQKAPPSPAGVQQSGTSSASFAGRFGPSTAPVAVAAPRTVVEQAAPDLLGGAGHPGTVTVKPKVLPPDMSGFSAMLSSAMHLTPVKIPAPDTSALKSAASAAQSALAAISAIHPAPVKIPSPDISALNAAKGAAAAAGASVGQGFAAGISSESGAVSAAAGALAAAAASAMSTRLVSHSPSQVTRKIGQDFDAGFSEGIAGNVTSVKAASASIGSASVASLLQGLAGGQSNVQAAISAVLGAASNPGAVTTIQQTIATLIGDVPAKDTALVRYLTAQQSKLSALANQQGKLTSEISNAQQLATSAISGASITSAYGYTPALATTGPLASQSLITGMQQQAGDTQNFAAQLQALQKMGLNATTESQLAQAGTATGLPLAEGLAQGGKGAVQQINAIEKQIVGASQQIGNTGGPAMYTSAQQVMTGLATGLKDELKAVDKEMSAEANAVIKTVQKDLGTKAAASSSSTGSTAAGTTTAAAAAAGSVSVPGLGSLGQSATAAAGGLGKAAAAGSAAAAGLNAVSGAAGAAAAGLGKISSALAPLLAASQPSPAGVQPRGGGYSGGSGGGGGGDTHVHVHTTVQGNLVHQQDLADHIQAVLLNKGSSNWQSGINYPGRAP